MPGKTLDFQQLIQPDNLGVSIARKWHEWHILRQNKITQWEELRKYIYATDTTTTGNAGLPWKNKTTIPKITQIRDNLFANYMASLFPKRKWLEWSADEKDSNAQEKRKAILNYMSWVTSQPMFKEEIAKLVLDFIDYGNCFGMAEWMDQRQKVDGQETKGGYVGPVVRRINPLDIVFNPTAPSFVEAPKIIKSLVSLGELKKKLASMSTDENQKEYQDLFTYLKDWRQKVMSASSETISKDEFFRVDGFTSFRSYVESDCAEVLTFYGDMYDREKDELLENHQIMVVDRHKVISKKVHPSLYGHPPIFQCGWRQRQDNLWAMGPLDNLVGMQYRIDHIENLKADVFDLIAFPVLKIKGYVEDFEWKPMARIICNEDSDVEMLAPPFQILDANKEIATLQSQMEEMAGSPKEAMGFRTPGEKTAYEVQRLENASARIFMNKIVTFEEFEERLLNAELEMASRNVKGPQEINVFDDDFKFQTFLTLDASDITGAGKIKPLAARHFADRAEKVQNLTNLFSSSIGQDPSVAAHFSSIKMAKMLENLLDLTDYALVTPFIRLAEQADAQKLAQAAQEQVMMEAMTPSGLTPDDHDHPEMVAAMMGNGGVPGGGPPQGLGAAPAGPPTGAPIQGQPPGFNPLTGAGEAPGGLKLP